MLSIDNYIKKSLIFVQICESSIPKTIWFDYTKGDNSHPKNENF